MATRKEQYLLERSSQFNLTTAGENRIDLVLTSNPDLNNGFIVVMVTAETTPVDNALVKILTSSGNPVESQFTNTNGQAVSSHLPAAIYQVVASAPGYVTSEPVSVNLPGTQVVPVTISLTTDPRTALNTIYGLILDQVSGTRLNNATVTLSDSLGEIVASTLTDNEGQYLLGKISNGSYTLAATRGGYEAPTPLPITVTEGNIANTDISLLPEAVSEGTVHGLLTNQSGAYLGGACVGLYSVVGSTETLVQTTFTNNQGFYLFGNVPAGSYLVKAKVAILV